MNKQKLIVVVVGMFGLLLVVGLVSFGLYLFNTKKVTPAAQVENPFGNPATGGTSVSLENKMSIRTTGGGTLQIPNILKGHEPIVASNGRYYDLYGPEYSTEGFTFSVQYSESDSEFLISLINEPIGEARRDAEKYLRNTLMLTDAQLCELVTAVTVTPDVNESYSTYANLGLSFCPGSVKLP